MTLKLLLVEDNPGDARLVREGLADCHVAASIVHAPTLAEATAAASQAFDAILLDLGLPDSSGVATVVAMRDCAPRVPLIVLTGLDDEAAGLEAVRLGAQDYLVKGETDGRLLTRAIRYAIERKHGEERLLAATEALEAANRSLDEFVSVASHDLRDPLAKVLALSSLLASSAGPALDEADRRCLEEILRSSRRMQGLIDALLAYARAVRRTPAVETVPLRRIVDEVLDDLGIRIKEQRAVVTVGSLPAVQADPVQMRQVVQNLVSNALKFAADGRDPRISITATEHGSLTRVSVADNGVGFSEVHAEGLFRPFERLGTRREGAGLGLTICRRIVEAHGGSVEASGAPGQGATFTFTLPGAPRLAETRKEAAHDVRDAGTS